jgi:hypothetical protein
MKNETALFFLGGNDLEMVTIRILLEKHAPEQWLDKDLKWGAKASDYEREIHGAVAKGLVPVLIELDVDMALPTRTIIIDHHAGRAGADMPTSLDQVFDFLGLDRETQWTRWFDLVAANDKGHIDGMKAFGASPTEIARVRQAEWRALGVDEQVEREVQAAISESMKTQGRLTLVTLPNNASSVVADLLHKDMGGPGFDNLLVKQPQKLSFYGEGLVIKELDDAWPKPSYNSWYGGNLEKKDKLIIGGHGYWGIEEPDPDKRQKIITHIKRIATD